MLCSWNNFDKKKELSNIIFISTIQLTLIKNETNSSNYQKQCPVPDTVLLIH